MHNIKKKKNMKREIRLDILKYYQGRVEYFGK